MKTHLEQLKIPILLVIITDALVMDGDMKQAIMSDPLSCGIMKEQPILGITSLELEDNMNEWNANEVDQESYHGIKWNYDCSLCSTPDIFMSNIDIRQRRQKNQ